MTMGQLMCSFACHQAHQIRDMCQGKRTMYHFHNSTDIFGQILLCIYASGVYYSYMVSGPNFEFHTQLLASRYLFLELIQGAFWLQNG